MLCCKVTQIREPFPKHMHFMYHNIGHVHSSGQLQDLREDFSELRVEFLLELWNIRFINNGTIDQNIPC